MQCLQLPSYHFPCLQPKNMRFRSVKKIEERLDAVEELLNVAGAMDEDGTTLQSAWLVAAATTCQHDLQQALQSWS